MPDASSILPLVGLAAETITPIAQLLSASANRKRAILPTSIDARQNAYTKSLMQIRDNLGTGAGYRSVIDDLGQQRATAQAAANKSTGGYYGGAITAADRLNTGYGENLTKVGGEALDKQSLYDQLIGKEEDTAARRSYDVAQTKYVQEKTEQTQNTQAGYSNLLGLTQDLINRNYGFGNNNKASLDFIDALPNEKGVIPNVDPNEFDLSTLGTPTTSDILSRMLATNPKGRY